MVLGTPGAKIMRIVEDLGQPRGPAGQFDLWVTSVFLGDLYDFVKPSDGLGIPFGVL